MPLSHWNLGFSVVELPMPRLNFYVALERILGPLQVNWVNWVNWLVMRSMGFTGSALRQVSGLALSEADG